MNINGKNVPKWIVGLIILFIAAKYGTIMDMIGAEELSTDGPTGVTTKDLLSIPWGIRAIFWIVGFWFLIGRVVGYLTVIAGIVLSFTGFGIIPGIMCIVVGVLLLLVTRDK
jgi:hypothetical protein